MNDNRAGDHKAVKPNIWHFLVGATVPHVRKWVALAVAGLALTSPARAVMTYQFTGSGVSAGTPVSATAIFAVSSGMVKLTLINTTPDTNDAAQLLTGVTFSLIQPDSTFITNAFLSAAYGVPRIINSDGTYSDGAPVSLLGSWERKLNGNIYQLDFNPDAKYAIVGPADGENPLVPLSGIYTSNGSISGNPGHNPFTAKQADFTLTSAAITENTKIGNVTFIYNTGLSYSVPGMPGSPGPSPIPEPTTGLVFGLGLAAACWVKARRPRTQAVAS
jgi:hypothetical protein